PIFGSFPAGCCARAASGHAAALAPNRVMNSRRFIGLARRQDAIPLHVMWPSTPAGRQHLAWRCRTCCLRANENPRPLPYLVFRGSIPHPMQSLCTLRTPCRQWPRNTRYRPGAARYPGPDLHRLDRASFAWRLHSLDHLVGTQQERGGSRNTDRCCGLEVEDELEFRRLLYRQVGWLGAARDPVDVLGGPPVHPI